MRVARRALTTALLIAGMSSPGAWAQVHEQQDPTHQDALGRVIVLVLDGVRWQDFFDVEDRRFRPDDGRPPAFEGTWKRLSQGGLAFGDRSRGSAARMTLSGRFSMRQSLPSYQAMLAGFAQPCSSNDCARIAVETLPEALARRLELPAEKVAVFSSWAGLERAAAHESGSVHVDAGDRTSPPADDGTPVNRDDERTAEAALDHLRRHAPRFLFVVFGAADRAAHAGDKAGYLRELRRLDRMIVRFFETLQEMGPAARARTTLIVTTDHGRGRWGPMWRYHSLMPFSTGVFVAATGPRTAHLGRVEGHPRTIQLSDLRPTIEILLGLEPAPCQHPTCGQPIPELIGAAPADPR